MGAAIVRRSPSCQREFSLELAGWVADDVDVLLRVYVKCIAGQQDEARRRIDEATRPPDEDDEEGPGRDGART